MQPELRPIVRRLNMEEDGDVYQGHAGDVEVVALMTTIGMAAGAAAAERIVGLGVDHVMVVGVAGGVDRRHIQIGDVVVPEVVIDRATGDTFRPHFLGAITPRGTLSCGDDFVTDNTTLDEWLREGVVAVDMETAAVAAVCERAQVPWSVYRGISDFAGEGLVDQALFAITLPDGTADPASIARYLEERPEAKEIFVRLAHDAKLATEAAAAATIDACGAL